MPFLKRNHRSYFTPSKWHESNFPFHPDFQSEGEHQFTVDPFFLVMMETMPLSQRQLPIASGFFSKKRRGDYHLSPIGNRLITARLAPRVLVINYHFYQFRKYNTTINQESI
jgi:hypothetical protein